MSDGTEILPTGISRFGVNAVVVTSVLTALAMVLAGIRFRIRGRACGADDYVLMASLFFLTIQLVSAFLLAFLGGEGWTTADLAKHPERITRLLQLIYFPELSYTLVVVLIKTSILLSYRRIFGHVKMTRYHIYILLGLSWGWGIAVFFTCLFQCNPIDKAWLPEKPGYCIETIPFLWGNSISNFVIDWMILAVPISPVLKLQLPNSQKVLVGLSFMCGSLACIASTIRSIRTASFDFSNLGVSDYDASIWVYSEPPLATISCCLPFLSRLAGAKVIKGFRHITNRVTKGSGGGASERLPSDHTHDQPTKFSAHQSSARANSIREADNLPEDSRNIHMITTTTVLSSSAPEEGHEMQSYKFPTPEPKKAVHGRSESTDALV